MGTQQLLLIVLGVIIVGIAVVVAISIFGSNAEQANKDAVTQDCLRLAAQAQQYYRKPTMLGGGGNAFTGITLALCGIKQATNANGTLAFENIAAGSVGVRGTSATVEKTAGTKSYVTITVYPDSVQAPNYTNW